MHAATSKVNSAQGSSCKLKFVHGESLLIAARHRQEHFYLCCARPKHFTGTNFANVHAPLRFVYIGNFLVKTSGTVTKLGLGTFLGHLGRLDTDTIISILPKVSSVMTRCRYRAKLGQWKHGLKACFYTMAKICISFSSFGYWAKRSKTSRSYFTNVLN